MEGNVLYLLQLSMYANLWSCLCLYANHPFIAGMNAMIVIWTFLTHLEVQEAILMGEETKE